MTTQRNPWHPDYKPKKSATKTVGRRKKEVATAPVHTSAAVDEDLTNGATVSDEAKGVVEGQTDDDKGGATSAGAGLSGDPNAHNAPSDEVPQGTAPAPAEVISESVTEVDDSLTPAEPVGGTSGDANAHNPAPDDIIVDGDEVTLKEAVEPVGDDTVEAATGETPDEPAGDGEAPWHQARKHDDVDATVPVGTDLPEGWMDMTLAQKREWLDANV